MKAKIASFILRLTILIAIVLLGFLGKIIYDEYIKVDVATKVEEFVSNITIEGKELVENVKTPKIIELETGEQGINSANIDYSNIVINKYFYNQINSYSKIFYNAIDANKENMKTGTYEINLGTAFTNVLSKDDGETLLGKYYQEAIEAYSYDNPDIFYLDFSKMYLNIQTTTIGTKKTYKVIINNGNEDNYLREEFQTKYQIDTALEKIEKIRLYFIQNKSEDDYENIKLIHDYIVESVEYDQTVSLPNIYNIYGAMINKKSVCEGYAKTFKYLLDSIGIPSIVVAGEGINLEGRSENHAWNYVQINQMWYAVDCTWDDPILIGGGVLPNSSKYKYFLKGQKDFNEGHTPDGKFSENGKIFEYPELSYYSY